MVMAPQIYLFLHMAFYALTFSFLMQRQHFLMSLFALEGMMLVLVAMIPLSLTISNMPAMTISVIMLTFGACEASLGLSLMVMMSRYYGSDMLKSLTTNKC